MEDKIKYWLIGFLIYSIGALVLLRLLRKKMRAEAKAAAKRQGLETHEELPYIVIDHRFELQYAIRFFLILAVLSFAYFYNDFFVRNYGLRLEQIDPVKKEFRIARDKDLFVFQASPEIVLPMRIFSVQITSFKKDAGSLMLLSHVLACLPFSQRVIESFSKYVCEFKAKDQLVLAQVMATDRYVKDQLDRLSYGHKVQCVRLRFVPLQLDKYFHAGVLQQALPIDPGSDRQYDMNKFLAVTAVESIPCR